MTPPARFALRPVPWLPVLRAAWAGLAVVIIALYLLGLAFELRRPAMLCPPEAGAVCDDAQAAARLNALGFPQWYAGFVLVLQDMVVPLVYVAVALLIFWRARQSWLGLAASVLLVVYGLWASTDVLDNLAVQWGGGPAWVLFFGLVDAVIFTAVVYLLFTFPDGRFTPRWMAGVAALAVVLLFLANHNLLPAAANTATFSLILIVGLSYQFYRYRRLSNPVQRQQTKWVLGGLAGFVANAVIWFSVVIGSMQRGLAGVEAVALFLPLSVVLTFSLPVALGISILRYRLWDIDLIIRRTLIYSALTAALALVYLASVLVLQEALRLLTGQTQSQFVTVVSTLAIAALFVPVRAAIQRLIDRRFYRRKYDAARTISDFSAAARDEVELTRLTADLVRVVDQTMQPAQITLWLRTNSGP